MALDHLIRRLRHAPALLSQQGVSIRLVTSAQETRGAYSLYHYASPAHFGGPHPHFHRRATESFILLSGRLRVRVEQETATLGPGEMIQIAPGLRHTFDNPHAEPVEFLILFTPGGMEDYFRGLAELVRGATSWPLPDMSPVLQLAAQNDTYS